MSFKDAMDRVPRNLETARDLSFRLGYAVQVDDEVFEVGAT